MIIELTIETAVADAALYKGDTPGRPIALSVRVGDPLDGVKGTVVAYTDNT